MKEKITQMYVHINCVPISNKLTNDRLQSVAYEFMRRKKVI